MEMSVYKRGEVYWYDFWFRGERHRDTTGLSNKTTALRIEAIRKAELAEGRAGITPRVCCPPFSDFANSEFLPWSEREHQAHPRTHLRYAVSAKPLIRFFGKYSLDSIHSGYVEQFKLARSKDVAPATVNRDLAALRLMLNLALREGYLQRNPVIGIRFLPEGPGIMRIISHEEQQRYLAAANPLLRDVATVIVETGMRPGEVFAIRSENLHLAQRYQFVPGGKTKFARRNVPLTESSFQVLKRRLERTEGPYLFPHRRDPNKPLTTLKTGHEAAIKAAEITPHFRIYDLRHTFGSRSAMAGVDLATLKELMGHSNISITMRYVHPTPEHKREAVQKLERFNANQTFRVYKGGTKSPQKSPQSRKLKVGSRCK
jgi:integrase